MNNEILVVYIANINMFENNRILPQYVIEEIFNASQKKKSQKRAVYGLLHHAVKEILKFDDDFSHLLKNESGKVISNHYHLSISHKNDIISVALSTQNVGVDIEVLNEKINIQNIAKTILNENENDLKLHNAYDICKLWVKKESKFKFKGEKKFEPKNINTLTSNFKVHEFEYENKTYLLGVCSNICNKLKIVNLL